MSTQSRNASAKSAIIINTMTLKVYENYLIEASKWHRIPDYSFQVSQSGLGFMPNNFFFDIINKIVQRLTPAGIIDHIIEACFRPKLMFVYHKQLKVLTVDQLSFGINIWLGFCAISICAFAAEVLVWFLKSKIRNLSKASKSCVKSKFKNAKVHPKSLEDKALIHNFPKDQEVFRICKNILNKTHVMEASLKIVSLSESDLNASSSEYVPNIRI
jgi:hypothetical protein